MFGGGEQLPAVNRERAFGFGLAAVVVGLVALLGSLMGDARALWYCMPRRWRPFRADVIDPWHPPQGSAPRRLTPADDAAQTREAGEVAIGVKALPGIQPIEHSTVQDT